MKNTTEVPAFPHIRSKETTATMLWDVVIALAPAAIFGVYRFGQSALIVLTLAVVTCMVLDFVCNKLRKKSYKGYEPSAIVTGLILGMSLYPEVPYWVPVAGGAVAVLLVKMLFGGLGRNILNPAVTALVVIFGGLRQFIQPSAVHATEDIGLLDTFLGFREGTIGGVSTFLLLLGGLYLVFCKVISLRIPFFYLLTFTAFTAMVSVITKNEIPNVQEFVTFLCRDGLLLGAFFMATDTTTSPVTGKGQIVYGILLGILTGVCFVVTKGGHEVLYGILAGNLLVRLIDRLTYPRYFGKGQKAKL